MTSSSKPSVNSSSKPGIHSSGHSSNEIHAFLRQQASEIHSVRDFQELVAPQLAKVLSSTTETFTVSGLEQLDPKQSYLFLSNHRDIVMDPAFVNWALYNGGFDTIRIAIGDNLVKPFVGDLMRINISFIVRRSVSGPRGNITDLLGALRIHQTIHRRKPLDLDRSSGGSSQRWYRSHGQQS